MVVRGKAEEDGEPGQAYIRNTHGIDQARGPKTMLPKSNGYLLSTNVAQIQASNSYSLL